MANPPTIENVHAVGRYALGVRWSDGHDSIFPFDALRKACPCDDCRSSKRPLSETGKVLRSVQPIAKASVMLFWGDDHETLFLLEELRELCGCAHCKGEPDYPITGQ